MLRGFAERLLKRKDRAPEPLMPGQSVGDDFPDELRHSHGGHKRYDMAAALHRQQEVSDARKTLGIDDDDITVQIEGLSEAAAE